MNFGTDSDFVREIENMCSSFVGHFLHVEGRVGTAIAPLLPDY